MRIHRVSGRVVQREANPISETVVVKKGVFCTESKATTETQVVILIDLGPGKGFYSGASTTSREPKLALVKVGDKVEFVPGYNNQLSQLNIIEFAPRP